MSVELFNYDYELFEEDPDIANEALEQWVDRFIDVYLSSPEYADLSLANKKAGGNMFVLFMDLNLNYVGGNLDDIDNVSAREIMEELFPRKLFCSDTQAKTIVPELIACWQCLKREINGNKTQTLKHADGVIGYLKSIKKNYLQMFKQGLQPPIEVFNPEVMEALFADIELPNDWVADLIYETTQNLSTILKQPAPPESWFRLYDLDSLEDFIYSVCIDEGIEDSESEAVMLLLGFALQRVFMNIRQKEKTAISFWQTIEQSLLEAYTDEELDPEGIDVLVHELSSFRHYLSDEFMAFVQQWLTEANNASHPGDEFTSEDVQAICQELLNNVPDEFEFAQVWNDQLAFMPPEGLELIARQILSLDNSRFSDCLALLVLDDREEIALFMAGLLAEHPQCISPLTLDRMVRVRNWLSGKVQKSVDKLIRNARKKGVSGDSAIHPAPIIETWMSIVDGSGAQGVMVMVQDPKAPELFRLVCFVFKEAVGIVDVSVSPGDTKKRLSQVLKMGRQHAGVFEKVSADLVTKQIPLFIALNLGSKTTIDAELIRAMELLGLEDWNPKPMDIQSFFIEYSKGTELSQPPAAKEIADVQIRSCKWPGTPMGDSWLISECMEYVLEPGGSVHKSILEACDKYLTPEKQLWQERMQRMSLWASQCNNKKWQKQARDFAVVSWLLGQDFPVHDIKLMARIAERSLSDSLL